MYPPLTVIRPDEGQQWPSADDDDSDDGDDDDGGDDGDGDGGDDDDDDYDIECSALRAACPACGRQSSCRFCIE